MRKFALLGLFSAFVSVTTAHAQEVTDLGPDLGTITFGSLGSTETFGIEAPIDYLTFTSTASNYLTLVNEDGSTIVFRPSGFEAQLNDGEVLNVDDGQLDDGQLDNADNQFDDERAVVPVPEPSSAALLVTGIIGVGAVARRRRSKV